MFISLWPNIQRRKIDQYRLCFKYSLDLWLSPRVQLSQGPRGICPYILLWAPRFFRLGARFLADIWKQGVQIEVIDFCVSKVWYKIHTTNKIDPIPLQILLF